MSTIYYTALTHSLSLTTLEHLPRSLICVGETGVIEWIEKDVSPDEVEGMIERRKAGSAELVRIEQGGLVPGLIDTHTVGQAAQSHNE